MIFSSSDPRLKYLYALFMVLGLLWVNYSHFQNLPVLTLVLSNTVVLLGASPLYFWLKDQQREAIPLMPMTGFFYAVTFGFVGFSRFQESIWDPWHFLIQSDTFNFALACVIAGLLSLYFAYYVLAPRLLSKVGKMPSFSFYVKSTKAYTLLAYIGFPGICSLYWLSRIGVLNNLTLSFHILSQFIFYLLMAAYFRDLLSMTTKVMLLGLIFPYQFFIGSLFLEGSIGPAVITLIAISIIYFAVKHKVPWGLLISSVLTILLIQPIKGEIRSHIWQLNGNATGMELKEGTTTADSAEELAQAFFSRYLSLERPPSETKNADDMIYESSTGSVTRRLNLLYPLAWICMNTPEPQPYRYGATYTPLLSKWIPRVFWQNKPQERLGNEWGRSYKLIREDYLSVSFNLPWIAEMYMNFGFAGVLGISFFLGLLFYILKRTICQVTDEPGELAFGIVLATPLMFPESHLSLVLGGVIVQAILVILACFLASKVLANWFGNSRTI